MLKYSVSPDNIKYKIPNEIDRFNLDKDSANEISKKISSSKYER